MFPAGASVGVASVELLPPGAAVWFPDRGVGVGVGVASVPFITTTSSGVGIGAKVAAVVSLPPAAGASVPSGAAVGLALGVSTMTTSNVVPFPAGAVSLVAGGCSVVAGGGGVGVSALGARKSTVLATAAAPSSDETITLHLPVEPGGAFDTANLNVVFDPRETTMDEGAERGSRESRGVVVAVAVVGVGVVVVVAPTEQAPPRAFVEQHAPATAERDPVAVPEFFKVTKMGPPPAPGAQNIEEDEEEEEELEEELETLTTSAAAVPCSSPATPAAPETLTLTVKTCVPAGSYLHATHCTTSAIVEGGEASASAEATFFRKEQLPLVSAAPAATDDDNDVGGDGGGRKSANWSAAVVALGKVPADRPTAVQFPGTYPPLSPHLGATQLDHSDEFIPRMLAVGAVAAVVPPVASRTGRRYLAATTKPSSASPGKERKGERRESKEVCEHQKLVLILRLLRAVSPPEMAAVAEAEVEVEEEEEEEDEASQGASDTDALNTAGAELLLLPLISPCPKLSTPTRKPNSALLCNSGLRHPCAKSGSSENAGPGKPAPQGHVRGSVALGDESAEEQVCEP